MFVDIANIKIKAGNGGHGAVSFRREKYVPSGGPDGGDGGKGGNIVFEIDDNLATLADFRYKRKYAAQNGQPGAGYRKTGKSGEDLIIKVPRGTIIKEVNTGKVMADMSTLTSFVAAKGGKGGWGNSHFANSTRQTPRFAKDGRPGEEWDISLELKLLADVGLLGFPSVGKSSLISVVSQARPKIGAYHFTTLVPNLGVVSLGDGTSFVMADIPGLIEGAGEGAGLGHEFLKHVDRCRLLIHIVDVAGSEGRNPKEDFEKINEELAKFDPELAKRPQIVAGNKIDLASDEQLEDFRKFIEDKGLQYFEICAPIKEGTKELINAAAAKLATLPPIKEYEQEIFSPEELLSDKDPQHFEISIENGIYYVEAPFLVKVMNKINPNDYENLQYFQHVLETSGIIEALRQKGINEGDTVNIYDVEFDFID